MRTGDCWLPWLNRRGKAKHKEVEAWERYHPDCQLAEVSIELAREVEAGGDSAHSGGDKLVQVPTGWCGQLEGVEADVVKGLFISAVGLVSILYPLIGREGDIVGLNHSVRHLEGRYHTEVVCDVTEYSSPILLMNGSVLGCASAQHMGQLETLQAVTALVLLMQHIQY